MAFTGVQRYVYFRVSNSGTPVTGLVKSNFTIIFTRNNSTPPDALTINEIGGGRYWAGYIPTTLGTDYLEIDNPTYLLQVINVEQIYDTASFTGGSNVVILNHNYPTSNALQVTESTTPALFTLYVYQYTDWQIGNQDTSYAVGQTALNTDGTWIDNISVLPGNYTIVIINSPTTIVIAQNINAT